jgi:hypothetical protein
MSITEFQINFSGILKRNVNKNTLQNFVKSMVSLFGKLLFVEEPVVSLKTSKGITEIKNNIISVKIEEKKMVGFH